MSRNRDIAAAADWDEGPPGAEADYAAYSGYPPQPAYTYPRGASGERHYACDPRYAAYETTPRSGGYRPAPPDTRHRPPPPPPSIRDVESSSATARRGDNVGHAHSRRARARSSSASDDSHRAHRRRDASSSSSSDSSERRQRRRHDSDRRRDTTKRSTKSYNPAKSDFQSNKTASTSNETNKEREKKQTSVNTSHKQRDRSITPPKSYKRRATSSSSSASSSSDSGSASRSRSRTPARPRRSRSHTPSQEKRSRSPSSSASSPSRSRSPSPHRHSDSSSSSRGCFSGYDRKRYFRKLKEQQAKDLLNNEKTCEEKSCNPPAGAVRPDSLDVDLLEYGDPPPVDGVNFEDLPPPPAELCGRAGGSQVTRKLPPVIPNDGSFLEMFKRMQEENQQLAEPPAAATSAPVMKKPVLPLIGKRRGGRVLKTGLVKKVKAPQGPADNAPKDAWSLYMQEVKKYRETSCEEERKTRPLVK